MLSRLQPAVARYCYRPNYQATKSLIFRTLEPSLPLNMCSIIKPQSYQCNRSLTYSLHNTNKERIHKISQLEQDLTVLLDKQTAQEAKKKAKPLSQSVKSFFGGNKSELINIGACVLFVGIAIQITKSRSLSRKTVAQKIEQDEVIEKMKMDFERVQSEEFAKDLARKCAQAIAARETDDHNKGKHGLFGWRRDEDKHVTLTDAGLLSDVMSPIIREAISDEILNEKVEKEVEIIQNVLSSTMLSDGKIDDFNQKYHQTLNEEESEVNEGETKVVRKRKFVM